LALFPITLGIGRTSSAESLSSSAQRLDKKKAEKTLKRDKYTCRFCGFHSEQFQRIVYCKEAGDPPFATACGFCELCLTLDRTGLANAGILVWLPEIGQAELHHIMRAIYIAKAGTGEIVAAGARALDALMARRSDAKKRLGTDDPLLLATVMHESLTDEEYENTSRKIDGIRLLPLDKHLVRTPKGNINQFPQMIKYWQSPPGPYGKIPLQEWTNLFKAMTPAVGQA
jgi:intracellular multiplication protein IcmJ